MVGVMQNRWQSFVLSKVFNLARYLFKYHGRRLRDYTAAPVCVHSGRGGRFEIEWRK